ncbi:MULTISPECIES: DUF4178 domain-containing protein [Delftia]|uniref:DUF4178 domain-containing protein n=1 Tax=Delftia TaxID=80865 RepID=UPI000774D995|nr:MULTISPECIES: DUF4178 domain-containing protein [Delftia]MPT52792.1 DUF4178 domain-containing protein [Delftia sp.]SFA90836.1 protein of unknown function [Delftia tsuruhatensis]
MASSPSQRVYRAPCPGCGAPVEFASAQASYAVCEFCRSTVVRQGDVLQRRGSMAEVFEDYSPLRIGATGQMLRNGKPEHFTLVGRLQLKSEAGAWSEWVAAFSDGALGFLSEDNGQFVWSWPWVAEALRNGPFKASDWLLGSQRVLGGKSFTVSSVQNARLVSAQGELAQLPEPGTPYRLVELRSEQGQVLSVDFSVQPPALTLGERVVLDDLRMQGLRDGASLKGEQGRHFNCPKCGAVVPVRFSTTKSLSCPSCGSLVDLSQGIGKELAYAEQNEPVRPAIPLGSKGVLEGQQWQVVGFQHRMGQEPGDDESFGWEEYLLFNQKAGFAFLVDSSDGWSMARVTTGVPKLSKNRSTAKYMGRQYQLESRYTAETTYALGEFYWPVQRGQTTRNVDYVSAGAQNKAFLASETESGETTWSHGSAVSATTLAMAFGLKQLRDRSQVGVMSGSRFGLWTIIIGLLILWLVFVTLRGCASRPNCDPNTDANCNSYTRSSGGSWGGYTSGGSHK